MRERIFEVVGGDGLFFNKKEFLRNVLLRVVFRLKVLWWEEFVM